ncbi:maleylpyruvate isomerase family mycothiol-dependent enzyme [Streptomyces antnestii]|uniref:maleylpyruvate isomerase family mycothiol-dependent enzyme n=1 Tax=Streptomyces antnestii TaxID=2494256 RepID=UPI001CB947F3|nr:maleylpyruvate isomerase family mycothiol-dependent enzyme [Streptomyces sp. San01]
MPDNIAVSPAEVALVLDGVRNSAARLTATLAPLTNLQAREPSALPGWSRGHVLTHLARSADVYRWLLTLARTGTEPGPRADTATLDRALHAGAGRKGTELVADLRTSLDGLLDEAASMPAERWTVLVTALAGWQHPAWFTLRRCRRELETHHADLNLDYTTANWPADYVTWALDDTLTALAAHHFPVARIKAEDLDRSWTLSATGPTVTGPGHTLLAWLAGRRTDLQLHSDLPLPTPPRWPLPPVPGWN